MSSAAFDPNSIPMAEVIHPHYEDAAQFLEKAIKAGCQDASVHYMLGLAHKRQGKIQEARAAFRKIQPPDANVWLQLGLLSLDEEMHEQAEDEFAKALALDPTNYPVCFNLLMTRLTQHRLNECMTLLPTAIKTASSVEDRRIITFVYLLINAVQTGSTTPPTNPDLRIPISLKDMTDREETRLLQLIRSLGDLEVVLTLLRPLRRVRQGAGLQEAFIEASMAHARGLMDKGEWLQAENILSPLAGDQATMSVSREIRTGFFNLLGCCACLNQDFRAGAKFFSSALTRADNDPRIHHNLALAQEWQGELTKADIHWNRFFDLLDKRWPAPREIRNYHDKLAFEGLSRLATSWSEQEKWSNALKYVERAQRVKPGDPEILERLFHLYMHNKKQKEARRSLNQLRKLRPNDPQYELYELDFIEVKSLKDVDHMLSEIDEIMQRHPGDARVEERAVNMVGNVVPLLGNLCDQLTDQMSRVIDQVRRLPNFQINWRAVDDVMTDLRREFNKLRKIANKCLPLVRNDQHRRIITDLIDHIDRKIDVCNRMGR